MNKTTPAFLLADLYVEEMLKRSPETCTMVGDHSQDHLLDDYSYPAIKKELEFCNSYLEKFQAVELQNAQDELAIKLIISDLNSTINSLTSNHEMLAYGVFNSPMNELRELFDFMEYQNQEDYQKLLSRLNLLPETLTAWLRSLVTFQGKGVVNSKRNVKELIRQALTIFENKSYTTFVVENLKNYKGVLEENLPQELKDAATHADLLHYFLAVSIEDELLTDARETDGVGQEAYQLFAQDYTYPEIDLDELYQYGVKEVASITKRMHEVASSILPNYSSLSEVTEYLNNHPNYKIVGKVNLVAKLRAFTDDAISALNGVEFDIPTEILNVDILLNEDSLDASPYYTPPSEDLSRNGATWFPTMGRDEFTIWDQLSTWYHEGVPGHHLQCGTQAIQGDKLTRYQRIVAWHSGYGEGWALYSERLMDELGFYVDPGYMFGYLQAQMLRAARIVIDLSLHTKKYDNSIQEWNFDTAVNFLKEVALLDQQYAISEVNRYLSAPGQAISYKVGERVWLELRNLYLSTLGDQADLKSFHAYALSLGSLPLDLFKIEVKSWISLQKEKMNNSIALSLI
jgi:uncharacterized protein (DUF885 family)